MCCSRLYCSPATRPTTRTTTASNDARNSLSKGRGFGDATKRGGTGWTPKDARNALSKGRGFGGATKSGGTGWTPKDARNGLSKGRGFGGATASKMPSSRANRPTTQAAWAANSEDRLRDRGRACVRVAGRISGTATTQQASP